MNAEKLERFRARVESEQVAAWPYVNLAPPGVTVKAGRRWTKVDVESSGKYMVDLDGSIYGIKAYGVPHLGKRYGNLDTVDEWDWSGYRPVRRERT